jgi:hypothetical protein
MVAFAYPAAVRETSVSHRRGVAPIRPVGKNDLLNTDFAALSRRVIAAGYQLDAAPRRGLVRADAGHGNESCVLFR